MSASNDVLTLLAELKGPISARDSIFNLLCAPLDALGLLPPSFHVWNRTPLEQGSVNVRRHLPMLHQVILDHIVPTWSSTFDEDQELLLLVVQYFCPDTFSFSLPVSAQVAFTAYSSILTRPLLDFSTDLLDRLTRQYPVDHLHQAIFTAFSSPRIQVDWEDYVRNVCMVPSKVSNVIPRETKTPIHPLLEHNEYFAHLVTRLEILISTLSMKESVPAQGLEAITYLINKFVNIGLFPATSNTLSISFFGVVAPTIRRKSLHSSSRYFELWSSVFLNLRSPFALSSVVCATLSSLADVEAVSSSVDVRVSVKNEAILLRHLYGPLSQDNHEVWAVIFAVLEKREWNPSLSRFLVCWVALDGNNKNLAEFLFAIENLWTSQEHVRRSLLDKHRLITMLFLLALSYFPTGSPTPQKLAMSPKFIKGVGTYLGHFDPAIRQCGMLTAELVAQRIGKKLDFGNWEGNDPSLAWAKRVRDLLDVRDADVEAGEVEEPRSEQSPSHIPIPPLFVPPAETPDEDEGDSDDDSLTGYSSDSSRSPSPTPSELQDMEKEPSIAAGVKRIQRPVFLLQLAIMLRGEGSFEQEDPKKAASTLEIALASAADLIRRKVAYGTELEENATNLTFLLIGLNNNFELDGFTEHRQGALNALVACSPTKAAPCIIQELFINQYSVEQRYAMLNALVAGAEELAGYASTASSGPSFPSKLLPPSLHQKYLEKGGDSTRLGGIVMKALTTAGERPPPDNPRERLLKVRRFGKVSEVHSRADLAPTPPNKAVTFSSLAAEYFISPLINRFWLLLSDEQMRESRTNHLEGRNQYRGAGGGLVLNPMVLAKLLGVVTILTYLAQNGPEWLAVIAPDALEVAVTVGTKPVSLMDTDDLVGDEEEARDASVLTASLDLALVVLEGCLAVDDGRSLGLDKTELLLRTKEWARNYFERLEEGAKLPGGGGSLAGKVRQVTAGILLKIDEIGEKWRRSMIDLY